MCTRHDPCFILSLDERDARQGKCVFRCRLIKQNGEQCGLCVASHVRLLARARLAHGAINFVDWLTCSNQCVFVLLLSRQGRPRDIKCKERSEHCRCLCNRSPIPASALLKPNLSHCPLFSEPVTVHLAAFQMHMKSHWTDAIPEKMKRRASQFPRNGPILGNSANPIQIRHRRQSRGRPTSQVIPKGDGHNRRRETRRRTAAARARAKPRRRRARRSTRGTSARQSSRRANCWSRTMWRSSISRISPCGPSS